MSNETWDRYCKAVEELRRLEDARRQRRSELTRVEIVNKALGVQKGIPISKMDGASVPLEDNVVGPEGAPTPRP